MSKENLDSYKLFFVEIPTGKLDYLSEIIINEDKTASQSEAPSPQHCNSLSSEQVRELANDSRKMPKTIKNDPNSEDTLFS
jgi:hypothetical protein